MMTLGDILIRYCKCSPDDCEVTVTVNGREVTGIDFDEDIGIIDLKTGEEDD